MKIIHIFLISYLSVVVIKTGFQPGAVTSPSTVPLPTAGLNYYYMSPGETITKAKFEEVYFSATTLYASPIVSQPLKNASVDLKQIDDDLKNKNISQFRVYAIVKHNKDESNFKARVQVMSDISSIPLLSVNNIPLIGKTPAVIENEPFPTTGNIFSPNLIKFTFVTSRQQGDCSCYLPISWDPSYIVGPNQVGAYISEFIFYLPDSRTLSSMQTAVRDVVSNAQQQNPQVDPAINVANLLKNVGIKDSDDWNKYVCTAFQAQAPIDPLAVNNPVQGTLTQQQQLQQSQLYVDKIAKAFGNGVGCTLTLASVSPQS